MILKRPRQPAGRRCLAHSAFYVQSRHKLVFRRVHAPPSRDVCRERPVSNRVDLNRDPHGRCRRHWSAGKDHPRRRGRFGVRRRNRCRTSWSRAQPLSRGRCGCGVLRRIGIRSTKGSSSRPPARVTGPANAREEFGQRHGTGRVAPLVCGLNRHPLRDAAVECFPTRPPAGACAGAVNNNRTPSVHPPGWTLGM